jgi:hypothetical protein
MTDPDDPVSGDGGQEYRTGRWSSGRALIPAGRYACRQSLADGVAELAR